MSETTAGNDAKELWRLPMLVHFLMVLRRDERLPLAYHRCVKPVGFVNPAAVCVLRNWVEFFAESDASLRPFVERVMHDGYSPATTDETFQSDFYLELLNCLMAKLERMESGLNNKLVS